MHDGNDANVQWETRHVFRVGFFLCRALKLQLVVDIAALNGFCFFSFKLEARVRVRDQTCRLKGTAWVPVIFLNKVQQAQVTQKHLQVTVGLVKVKVFCRKITSDNRRREGRNLGVSTQTTDSAG